MGLLRLDRRLRALGGCVLGGLLLRARLALARLATAFGNGDGAVFVRFVFGHGQSSLGAVGAKGGKDLREAGGAAWLRALGLTVTLCAAAV
jgi:hypothetical protein